MDRRNFLHLLMCTPLWAKSHLPKRNAPSLQDPREGTLVVSYGHEKHKKFPGYMISLCSNAEIRIISTSGKLIQIPAPAKGHEFIQHPVKKSQIFTVSRWAKYAYLADTRSRSLLKIITLPDGELFQGHCVYSDDGKLIYAAQHVTETGAGYVCVIDSETLKILKKIPTHGLKPHQIRWVEKDKLLATMNSYSTKSGGPSLYSVIDVTTGIVTNEILFSRNGYAHFQNLQDERGILGGRMIQTGDSDLGELIYGENEKKILIKELPHTIAGEPVEVVNLLTSHERKLVVLGAVGLRKLYFYDLKQNKLIKSTETKINPLGMVTSPDGKFIYVCYGESQTSNSYIKVYSSEDFYDFNLSSPLKTLPGGNGSHLTLLDPV